MKKLFFLVAFCCTVLATAQDKNFRSKTVVVENEIVKIDSVSINSKEFKVFSDDKTLIKPENYTIDFGKAELHIPNYNNQQITIEYYVLPTFLTKIYSPFDENRIVENPIDKTKLYSFSTNKKASNFKPFDGLNTNGNISRGITIGNNQDAVVNSTLDLQIAGKLSEKVNLRASITDSNIPIQENGYTQQLNEFDRVFIELFSDDWSIKGGDINLQNNSYFGNFDKKVAGVSVDVGLGDSEEKTSLFASGALVRGKFSSYQFTGQNANQGPYRLRSPNGEQFIVIISGSERIFVNGRQLKRGQNNDYVIDYNTAEITFMPTFPVTADMRFVAEFQFADRNYTRFITYDGAKYESEKLTINGHIYHESDVKNQPLQLDLNDDQKQILANAGNDTSQMVVPSAFADAYDENKILYRKELVGTLETFVYSNDPNDDLFNVRFSYVGENQGDYQLQETIATGKIYSFVGVNMGDYSPVIQLVAPTKLQMAVVNANYSPNEKTSLQTEVAFSNNDANLFSNIDDDKNTGLATKIDWKQLLIDKKWKLQSSVNYRYIAEQFSSVQRFNTVEFNRDWNVFNAFGNQQLVGASLRYFNDKNTTLSYNFEHLNFSDSFQGTKHDVQATTILDNFEVTLDASSLKSSGDVEDSKFDRANLNTVYRFNNKWIGAHLGYEDNQRTEVSTQTLNPLSAKFLDYGAYVGVGDSTKVFAKIGYAQRTNDSLRVNSLTQVNKAHTYYIASQLVKNKNSNLRVYANYRTVDNLDQEDIKALNSRVQYSQKLANQMIQLQTVYETTSGRLPQQEFTYVEVEAGQGFYAWIDYNNNNIQELDEFEVAQFSDQARFLRVALPNINYINTNRVKFSQSMILNPSKWTKKKGFKGFLSQFYNQSFVLIDNQQERLDDSFSFNPFEINDDNLLGLNFSLKNSLFFHKGKQRYSTTYNFLKSENKSLLNVDRISNDNVLHQLQFTHKMGKFWLFDVLGSTGEQSVNSVNFANRNYKLKNESILPKLSFLQSNNSHFDVFYEYKTKANQIGSLERLKTNRFGALYHFANAKNTSINLEFNYLTNNFTGNQNSAIGYQMLEGLQAGKNYTWSVLFQRKITSYLNLNLNYNGRKSENSTTIHNGNVQLRAHF